MENNKNIIICVGRQVGSGGHDIARMLALDFNLKYYDQCENFYIKLRAAVRKAQVTNACLNIRGFVRALTAVAESDGKANLKRQIEIHVVNTTSQEDRSAILPILSEIVTL